MNVVLIGARRTGKTTVAYALAERLWRPVLSLDQLISYECQGRTIAELVREWRNDWRIFREIEYQVVCKAAALDAVILDCGGGVVVDIDSDGEEVYSHRKVSELKRRGLVIWLQGVVDGAATRGGNSAQRPALHERYTEAEIMQRRLPFYREAADRVVEVSGRHYREVAALIAGFLPPAGRRSRRNGG